MLKYIYSTLIFLASFQVYSQEIGTIYFGKDTLRDVQVADKSSRTNYRQVTFTYDGFMSTLRSEEVSAYWKGNRFMKSYQLGDKSYAFIQVLLAGPCTMGKIITEFGETQFAFMNKEVGVFHVLEGTEDATSFFKQLLPSYDLFQEQYKKSISYDQKSLGELASSYNQFSDSSKYKFTSLRNQRSLNAGMFVSANQSKVVIEDDNFLGAGGRQYGIFFDYTITPRIAVNLNLGLAKLQADDGVKSISLNAFRIENAIALKINKSKKVSISLAPGFLLSFNSSGSSISGVSSHTGTFFDSRRIEGLSSGTFINLLFDFKTARGKRRGLFLGRSSTGLKQRIDSLGPAFSAVQEQDGKIKALRMGLNIGF